MPVDLLAIALELIAGEGLEIIKDKAKRNEAILHILNQIPPLRPDAPLDERFDGVYAYTLVHYATGTGKPKPLLEFFRHPFIKDAFWKSFVNQDVSILDDETENFLEWNQIGKDILAMDFSPQREFAEFREQFILAAKLTRTVKEVLVDQILEGISGDIQDLPTEEDLTTQLSTVKDEIIGAIGAISKREKAVPFILPQLDISNFTGREDELKQLEKQIFQEGGSHTASIVAITGTGGMGKSALAVHFASKYESEQKYKDRFPDGVIGLRVNNGSVDTIAQRFASYAGVEIDAHKGLSAAEIMQSVFQHRQALLIFDNAEDAFVKDLRPGGDNCVVIVTTRDQGLLRSLDIPESAHIRLDRFSFEETKILLLSMVGFERINDEEMAIREIHELVGGLPLALRIVGGTLADQSFTPIASYITNLRNEKKRLAVLKDPGDSNLDIYATFAVSFNFLTPLQVELFASLGVCAPEGFSLKTIESISEQSIEDVQQCLGRLIKLSLLNKGNEINRFMLHPLLYIFAGDVARERKIYQQIEEQHTRYFTDFVAKHRDVSIQNFEALALEQDEIIFAIRRAIKNKVTNYDLFSGISNFLESQGYWAQALELLTSYLLILEENQEWSLLVENHLQRTQFLKHSGKVEDAKQALLDAEKVLQNIVDINQHQGLLAKILNSRGIILQREAKYEDAIKLLRKSLNIEQRLKNERGQAMVLNSLGGVLRDQGKFNEAVTAFEESYSIGEKLGDYRHLAKILNSLGGVFQNQGRFIESADALKRSYDLFDRLGDNRGKGFVLNSLGGVLQRQGKLDEAINFFEQSCEIAEKMGDKIGYGMRLTSLGGAFLRQDKLDEAVALFQDSIAIFERYNEERSQAMALNSLGVAYDRYFNKFEESYEAFQKSITIGEKLQDDFHLARVWTSLGNLFQHHKKFNEANDAFKKSIAIGEGMHDNRHLMYVWTALGNLLQLQHKFEESLGAFQKSMDIAEKFQDVVGLAITHFGMGKMHLKHRKYVDAKEHLCAAFEINEKLKNTARIQSTIPFLVKSLRALGEASKAKEYLNRAIAIIPDDEQFLKTKQELEEIIVKSGRIGKLRKNPTGQLYTFITPDDGSTNVYFNEKCVNSEFLVKLEENVAVMVEIEVTERGHRAKYVWLKEKS